MARIEGVDPDRTEKRIRTVLEAQAERWGAPLLNHLIYACRPTIFRGVRGMWGGLEGRGWWTPRSSPSRTEGSPRSTAASSDRT